MLLSFASGLLRDAAIEPALLDTHTSILEGSIGIARRLGLQSVAEGVETEDDWHLLRELGCDVAQGYFVGRPMPASRVAQRLQLWRPRHASLSGQ